MAIILNSTGLEVSIGPFELHLTPRMVGIGWRDHLDAMLERRKLHPGCGSLRVRHGHFTAWLPGLYLSVFTPAYYKGDACLPES